MKRRTEVGTSLYSTLGGLIAGVALDVLTYWVARAGPVGEGWSFRGNGALVVPLGLGPAVLAGGWTALVLYARGVAGWRRLGIAALLLGALPSVSSVLVLVALGRDAQSLSDILTLPAFAWPLLALALAAMAPLHRRSTRPITPLAGMVAGLAFTIALLVGFVAAQIALPPGAA
jgi:hypothetical protein